MPVGAQRLQISGRSGAQTAETTGDLIVAEGVEIRPELRACDPGRRRDLRDPLDRHFAPLIDRLPRHADPFCKTGNAADPLCCHTHDVEHSIHATKGIGEGNGDGDGFGRHRLSATESC